MARSTLSEGLNDMANASEDHSPAGSARRLTAAGRRIDVELLRVVSLLGVVTIHATGPFLTEAAVAEQGPSYWVALSANGFSRASVALFFALAGWAQLRRDAAEDEAGWLGRRLVRLVLPLLTWSVIYLGLEAIMTSIQGKPTWVVVGGVNHWLQIRLREVLFGPGVAGHLWFVYFLIPMTIVIWLIQVAPRGDVTRASPRLQRAIVVAGAALVAAYAAISMGVRVNWTGFAFTLGYAAVGYAILSWWTPRRRLLPLALYLSSSLAIVILSHVLGRNSWPAYNQSLFTLLAVIGALGAASGLTFPCRGARIEGWVRRAGSMSFGAYLAHILVLRWLLLGLTTIEGLAGLPGLVKLGILDVGTFLISLALAAAWHRSRRLAALLG